MTPEKIDYVAILNDMKAKRAVLDASIAALEAAVVSGMLGATDGVTSGADLTGGASAGASGPVDLPKGAFLGKNMTDAVLLYLGAARQRKTVKDIAAALMDGGIVSTSQNFTGVVQAKMQQLGARGQVLKFADGWGLAEWSHPSFRRTSPEKPTKGKKKKSASKSKTRVSTKTRSTREPTIAAEEENQAPGYEGKKPAVRIEAFLNSSPGVELTSDVIAREVSIPNVRVAEMLLAKLVKKGLIEKTAAGTYRSRLREMPKAV